MNLTAASHAPAPGVFARVLRAEQLANARRLNALRFIVVSAFLALESLPFIPTAQRMEAAAFGALAGYAAAAALLFFLARRSGTVTHFSRLAIPLLDLPLVFVIQRLNLIGSEDPRAVANFTLAIFMCLILLAALSIDRWQIATAAAMAAALGLALQAQAGEKLHGEIAGVILLATTAAICEFARARRIEMVWTLSREQLRRERLGRYFSPDVAVAIEETADGSSPARLCEVTVLFSDLRDFTTLAEKMDTPEIVALLNEYFEQMVAVVFEHGGTLDKYIGDGLMVYFGAPVAQDDHAARAVRCARAMQARLAEFNQARLGGSGAGLRMGIGIHTGPAVVGSIGASHRREYTAIGDTVNVASRIEQLCKSLQHNILISGDTRSRAGDAVALRPVSECAVKGRSAPVQVFTPGED